MTTTTQREAPLVEYAPRLRRWRLLESYVVRDGIYEITIPAPFTFDLASVPRWLWSLLASHELGIVAPLCHDFLYATGGYGQHIEPQRTYTRIEADVLFLGLLRADGVSAVRRYAAYAAVRLFGWKSWRGRASM